MTLELARKRQSQSELIRELVQALEPYVLIAEHIEREWPKSYRLLKAREALEKAKLEAT